VSARARLGFAPRKRNVMADELIRPIDEDTAKAIEESAKALGKGI
jgi:hypothetical protein